MPPASSPPTVEVSIPEIPRQLYTDGHWREGGAGTFDVGKPSDEAVLAYVADADEHDIADAVNAAGLSSPDGCRPLQEPARTF